MKIADEIVDEMRETFCWGANSPLPGLTYALIAAKLEPVRKALDGVLSYMEHDHINYAFDHDDVVEWFDALSLFEEE